MLWKRIYIVSLYGVYRCSVWIQSDSSQVEFGGKVKEGSVNVNTHSLLGICRQ